VTEQLRIVQQQITEFQVLERQLGQVLQRLQTTAPAAPVDGCDCLGSEPPEAQGPHPLPIPQKGEAMRTSALEAFTILTPAPSFEAMRASEERCGCGCGCGASLTQLTLPQDAFRRTGDQASAQPRQS
jgi:hypothetical protein